MKKNILLVFIIFMNKINGANYYINSGITLFNQTEQQYKQIFDSQEGILVLNLGFDLGWAKKKYEYGLGISVYSPIKYSGNLYDDLYLLSPIYFWNKYTFFDKKLYIKSKLGVGVNYKYSDDLQLYNNKKVDVGLFLGISTGYSFSEKSSMELSYEVAQFRNSNNSISFEDAKIFREGATDLVSFSFVYKIGTDSSEKASNVNGLRRLEELEKQIALYEKSLASKDEVINLKNQTIKSQKNTINHQENIVKNQKDLLSQNETTLLSLNKTSYIFTLNGFDAYEVEISSKMKNEIKNYFRYFDIKEGSIEIESYVDNTGSLELNEKLKKERTQNLILYLKELGLDKSFVIKEIFPEVNLYLNDNLSKESRKGNRRFVISVISGKKE